MGLRGTDGPAHLEPRTYALLTRDAVSSRAWCAVTKEGPSREAARVSLLGALLQRVRVPSRQASEHRVAGPDRTGGEPDGRAGCQKGLRTGQARGPQHEVKPAASSEKQSGSRAAHVTAKAPSGTQVPKRVVDPGGARGAARVQGEARNSGDPSACPSSGQGTPYKPVAKSVAAQRESEGAMVPKTGARASGTNGVQNNAPGGKGPWGGRVGGGGTREGMTGETRSNFPGGPSPEQKCNNSKTGWVTQPSGIRSVVSTRCTTASRGVTSSRKAWRRVRRNKVAAGVDAETLSDLEEYGVERFLEELATCCSQARIGRQRCCAGTSRRLMGRSGRLGIPTVRDRVVADGGEAGAGADLRGGLPSVLVRLPPQAERDDGPGDAAEARARRGTTTCLTPTSATTSGASTTRS